MQAKAMIGTSHEMPEGLVWKAASPDHARAPRWYTATSSPYAVPRVRPMERTARSGTNSERKARPTMQKTMAAVVPSSGGTAS